MTVNTLLKEDSNLYPIYSSSGVVSEPAGGVSPIGWTTQPDITLIDEALSQYPEIWAAAGHPHGVFPTTFQQLQIATGAKVTIVGD